MKKLLLLLALLTFSAASFADGSVICEDRTTVDAVYELSDGETECRDGYTKQGNQCIPEGSGTTDAAEN